MEDHATKLSKVKFKKEDYIESLKIEVNHKIFGTWNNGGKLR